MTEYRSAKLSDLEAITFDHFNTLQYSPRKREDKTLQAIIRALSSKVALDADVFAAKYLEVEGRYQLDLEETGCETLMNDLILIALHESGHDANKMVEDVAESVDEALAKYEETLAKAAGFRAALAWVHPAEVAALRSARRRRSRWPIAQ